MKEKKVMKERKERIMREDINIEFKELDRVTGKLPDSLPKEIISFANTEGGEIYIGIQNYEKVVGVNARTM